MMDAAFQIGRKALLDWLNSTFSLRLTKIEETSNGAVACQIVDAVFPGELAVSCAAACTFFPRIWYLAVACAH